MKEHAEYEELEMDQEDVKERVDWLWEVLEEFDQQLRATFLFFVTGSFKVPFKGFQSFPIKIRPAEGGPESLPVAHTCFNELELPEYASKEILREKLLLAILEGKTGFYIA